MEQYQEECDCCGQPKASRTVFRHDCIGSVRLCYDCWKDMEVTNWDYDDFRQFIAWRDEPPKMYATDYDCCI